jgi:hypothetical protein
VPQFGIKHHVFDRGDFVGGKLAVRVSQALWISDEEILFRRFSRGRPDQRPSRPSQQCWRELVFRCERPILARTTQQFARQNGALGEQNPHGELYPQVPNGAPQQFQTQSQPQRSQLSAVLVAEPSAGAFWCSSFAVAPNTASTSWAASVNC